MILCANTAEEYAELQVAGVRCIYFNHNATLDERIFQILAPSFAEPRRQSGAEHGTAAGRHAPASSSNQSWQHHPPGGPAPGAAAAAGAAHDCHSLAAGDSGDGLTRPFRLVVNSAFVPYKRLALAAQVPGAAFISYWPDGKCCSEQLPPGTCLNLRPASSTTGRDTQRGSTAGTATSSSHSPAGPEYAYLSPAEVAVALNRCMVGEVFSQEEGTCWAATEYLLCGLPVVSTPSRVGREVWLNSANCIIVEPNQVRVAWAVCVCVCVYLRGAATWVLQFPGPAAFYVGHGGLQPKSQHPARAASFCHGC